MNKKIIYWVSSVVLWLGTTQFLLAQTGPNSPQTRANDATIGSNAWSNPSQIINSNNAYASVSTKGITNYLSGTNFNFAISVPSAINGIMLEIERSTNSSTAVAVLNNWTTGLTKTVSAGVNRCMVVAMFLENGLGPRDVTAITYGGQSLTQITEGFVGSATGFCGRIEYWRLMETGITAAANTSFVVTYNGTSLLENWEALTSAVYQFVDQTIPVSSIQTFTSNSSTNPITLSPSLTTLAGGMSISGVFCGNNTSPASSVGGTNTYLINSSFTEVIDTYSANSSASASGGAFQVAHKATVTSGSEAPTYTFAGTANRQMSSCIHLQGIREVDNSVRLIKGGIITGNDYAQTTAAWPTTDAYATYGGSTDLWGTTWTDSDINANSFGAVISASVQNGTAQVDHMRITIFSSSTLPVELIDFSGENKNGINYIRWQTATERNSKHFVVERSYDGINFIQLGTVQGNGNSLVFNSYEFADKGAGFGNNYYRLKQIDHDGTFEYFKNIVIDNPKDGEVLKIYPNPSFDGRFNIAASQTMQQGVYIYTQDMKLVKQLQSTSSEMSISLEELADGVYYLVFTINGAQKIKRIEKTCRGN